MDKEQMFRRAVELLRKVLVESIIENEFDKEIYLFLHEVGELPEDYNPYF